MTKGFIYKILVGSILITSLQGCGGSSSSTDTNTGLPVFTGTTINSFNLVGTSAVTGGVVKPINAAVNLGQFSVNWNVTSTNPYVAQLYLSEDTILDTANDPTIFSFNCGSSSTVYSCNETGNFTCTFDNNNMMLCGTSGVANIAKDLTTFLNTIPKSATFIFRACNSIFDSCKTSSVLVEIQ